MIELAEFSLDEIQAEICRASFKDFVLHFWDKVPGAMNLQWNWHMDVLCNILQEMAERVFRNEPRKYDLVCNISPGTSKPVWEETPILMGDGSYKPLRDIRVGEYVIGRSGNGRQVKEVHLQGRLNCVSLNCASGRELVLAPDHPVMTPDGWVEAGKLQIGDLVGLMHSPKIQSKSERGIDEFSLAGYFVGDGSCSDNNCSITNKDPEYIEHLMGCIERLGFDCSTHVDKNGVTSIRPRAKKGRRGPRDWLRDVGLAGKTSKTKEIPSFVWSGSDEQVKAFLVAYFHCDGCVSWKDSGKRNININIGTISPNLAWGLQRLFLRFGISLRIRCQVAKAGFVYNRGLKNYKYYVVSVTDQDAAARFLQCIPLLGPKARKLAAFRPKRRTFHQEYWPDKIISIENVGERKCRCLTVDQDDSFVADGIVVHNSSIASVLFHGWIWTRMPTARIMSVTHTQVLAEELADKCRELIRSEKYKSYFPNVQIRADLDAKSKFANTLGGQRSIFTVSGKDPMGMHFHFCTIDDPIDPRKAVSEAELTNARAFVESTIPSRRIPPDRRVPVIMLIMQRLHRNDPSGVMLERARKEGGSPTYHLCVPAELTDRVQPPELQEEYIDGLMDPIRLGKEVLRTFQADLGAYAYAGQFLQSPTALGGGRFREKYFTKLVPAAPYACRRVRSWDRAATSEGGAATAGVLMAMDKDGNIFVENCVHGHWETEERNAVMLATAQADRRRYGPTYEPIIWIEGEGGASGRDSFRSLIRVLAGFPVFEFNPRNKGDKDARSEPWAAQLAGGNVYFVDDGSWDLNGYIQEHLLFKPEPGVKRGKLKDRVDCSSQGLSCLLGAPHMEGPKLEMVKVGSGVDKKLKIIACGEPDLATLLIEEPCLLVKLASPKIKKKSRYIEPDLDKPANELQKVIDYRALSFADIQPSEYQEQWNEPVKGFGQKPAEIIMRREEGKYLWSFLLKRRPEHPRIYVVVDQGGQDRRAVSLAYGMCDAMLLPRKSTVWQPANPDNSCEGEPPNLHVYEMVKASREMVVE